jgi:hypothetical protein
MRTSLRSSKAHTEIHKPVCKQSASDWYMIHVQKEANQMHCLQTGLWLWLWINFELHNEVQNDVCNIEENVIWN